MDWRICSLVHFYMYMNVYTCACFLQEGVVLDSCLYCVYTYHIQSLYFASVCPQTLERSYLLKVNGKVVERPQHMLMRVAVGIHQRDIDTAIEVHATPTPISI